MNAFSSLNLEAGRTTGISDGDFEQRETKLRFRIIYINKVDW